MWTKALDSLFGSSGMQFRPELCLRARSPRLLCSRCADECPPGALDLAGHLPSLHPSRCSECGVCAAVCPVEAFSLQPSPVDLFVQARERGAVRLACGKLPTSSDAVRVPCYGYLDVSLVTAIALAATGGVWLDTSRCQTCEGRRGFSAARRNFDAAGRLFNAMGLRAQVAFQPDRPTWLAQPSTDVSRRDLMRRLAGRASTAATSLIGDLVPQSEANQAGLPAKVLPLRRRLLLHVLHSASVQASEPLAAEGAPWAEPSIGPTCSACLLCVTFCPTAALTLHEDTDQLAIRLDSSRCVACGACAEICPSNAITFAPVLAVGAFVTGQTRPAASFPRRPCPHCGQSFVVLPRATLCPRCQKDEELEKDVTGWV